MAEPAYLHIEDFCCIEKAAIQLRQQGLILITGDNQDTAAANNNGAGKSTIFKALLWCLFGKTLDGDKHDRVIRRGAERAEVQILLIHPGGNWVVRRWRERGKPGLEVAAVKTKGRERSKTVYQEPVEGSPDELQAKIIELLGRDFRAFCNTSMFGQGDHKRFFSAGNQERSDTLHKITRSDIYRRAEMRLREGRAKTVSAEITKLEHAVEVARSRIEEYDLEDLERQVDEWEEEQERKIDIALESVRQNTEWAKKVAAETKKRRTDLEKALADAEEGAREIERMEQEAQEAETKAGECRERIRNLETKIRELDYKAKGKGEKLELFAHDRCPECTAPLTQGAPAAYRKKLEAELKEATAEADPLRVQLKVQQGERAKFERQITQLEHALNEAGEAVDRPEDIQSELNTLDATSAERAASYREAARTALEHMKGLEAEENPHEAGLERARERLQELKKERAEREKELKARRLDMAHIEFWLRGFRALPSLLLDSVMPYVTERTNAHLMTLADGDISVEINTQRELKKGGQKDEITITCMIEGVDDATPSDGQKKKLEIGTDLALVDLAMTREHGSDLLFLDEVLDGLDAEGEARVMRLLRDLRSQRSSIFVITHEPDLAQAFERQIHVVKSGKAASVTEVK